MKKFAIGLDFGTNSCRSLIVDLDDGTELASHVFPYPSGRDGILLDPKEPNLARQNPQDYLDGTKETITEAISGAQKENSEFDPLNIIGIGIDTTGSSPMPVNGEGTPLCLLPEFKNNLNSMVWLWKDHTGHSEAVQITELAKKICPEYLSKIGGTYSSEWFWSKVLHCYNTDPDVFNAAESFVEICDWIPAVLTGETKPEKIKRSICAAGHKAMYNDSWGGLPDKEFLSALSPVLAPLRDKLYKKAFPSDKLAGKLSKEWANELGLREGIAIAVGAFDAHMGAVGAGVKPGTLVKILGTSTCDIMVSPHNKKISDIPGVCGIVDGSVMPGYFGIEAGQSAVGDIFLWFLSNLVPEKYGKTIDEKFENLSREAEKQKPGEHGLLALDWNNGNRTILVDVRLTGLLLGQTLHTEPHEIYRALIEATAFGALTIINRIEEYGVPVKEIVNCGGLASKNPFLMQVYADITGRPMEISGSEQTPALGAAIFGAVAAGKEISGFSNIEEAQDKLTGIKKRFEPDLANNSVYKKLYALYKQLHDAFGTEQWSGKMHNVMKNLLIIRDQQRKKE
ncbi:ribulokinase [candidate division WOR-3 bacterium]|nr:ribulokinase [candidate division WOR-3 bacterium]